MPDIDQQLGHERVTRRNALKLAGVSLATTPFAASPFAAIVHAQETSAVASSERSAKRVLIAGGGIGDLPVARHFNKCGKIAARSCGSSG